MTDEEAPNVQYPREEFVRVIESADTPLGTQDVADTVGCSYPLAYERLNELADKGKIHRQKIGQSYVWSINQ